VRSPRETETHRLPISLTLSTLIFISRVGRGKKTASFRKDMLMNQGGTLKFSGSLLVYTVKKKPCRNAPNSDVDNDGAEANDEGVGIFRSPRRFVRAIVVHNGISRNFFLQCVVINSVHSSCLQSCTVQCAEIKSELQYTEQCV
jgi:hypothetical protein